MNTNELMKKLNGVGLERLEAQVLDDSAKHTAETQFKVAHDLFHSKLSPQQRAAYPALAKEIYDVGLILKNLSADSVNPIFFRAFCSHLLDITNTLEIAIAQS